MTQSGTTRMRWGATLGCCAVVVLAGAWCSQGLFSLPAVTWLFVYNPGDFGTWAELTRIFWNLRVPLPPLWSLLEIMTHWLTGSTALWYAHLNRVVLISAFVLPVAAWHGRVAAQAAATALALLFLAATSVIHPQNPQIYDLHFALLLCAVAVLYARACRKAPTLREALFAGCVITLLELTRPFVLLLLLLVLPGFALAYWRRGARGRTLAAFFLPIVLLSGTW